MKRPIGKTGVKVQSIGYGGMPLSIQNRPSENMALEVLRTTLEAGTDFIDTANVYCLDDHDMGHNERLIAKALQKFPQNHSIYVATKGGLRRPRGDWTTDGHPKFLRECCEQSLKALNVDSIYLYQLHAVDSKVPIEESVGELKRLQQEGKIQHLGLSNVTVEQAKRALKMVRIESIQNRCNPFEDRDYHNDMLEFCEKEQITYLPHSPVGGHHGHVRLIQSEVFEDLSEKYHISVYCICLAWHLTKSPWIVPIPGASRVESAKDSPQALNVRLSPEDIRRIDDLE